MVERIDQKKEDTRLDRSYRFYTASSIADMSESRDEILDDIVAEHERWLTNLSRFDRFAYKVEEKDVRLFRVLTPDVFIGYAQATILLPLVRHFPQEDPADKKGVITIQDQSGSCNVELPLGGKSRYVIRNESLEQNPKLFRENSWSGVVALKNVYNVRGRDRSFLIYVDRIIDSEKDRSPAFAKMLRVFGTSMS